MYFDTPKKNNRKVRSNSKAKMQIPNNSTDKIMQKDKENNYGNVKNGGNNNNNNLNSSNKNKYINKIFFNCKLFNYKMNISDQNGQPNSPNGIYPSNYGLYLSNSSLFSKLGNEIISSNGKINNNQSKNKINNNNLNANQNLKSVKNSNNLNPQVNGINPNGK